MFRSAALAHLAAFVLLTVYPVAAAASGQIERFLSHIEIHADGSAEVVEAITIRFGSGSRAAGLTRLIELKPVTPTGRNQSLEISDATASRGGGPETLRRTDSKQRIGLRTGSRHIRPGPGSHTIEIRYIVKGAVQETETHVEFYWDVTGNHWAQVIARAAAVVTLPEAVAPLATVVRTGLPGARDRDFEFGRDEEGRITVTATKPLVPGEGMRLTIAWPRPPED